MLYAYEGHLELPETFPFNVYEHENNIENTWFFIPDTSEMLLTQKYEAILY